ncbi:hypothetical protein N7465_008990 [Penicillium sp. CMV-2018d]|nr:hypothetical protein N7465_008990 [Penicillium sp. CMV-2018d]
MVRVAKTKAIFEVLWHRQPAVAKCWTPSEFQRVGLAAQSLLSDRRDSSLFSYGYILVLAKVKGEPLQRGCSDVSIYLSERVHLPAGFSCCECPSSRRNCLHGPCIKRFSSLKRKRSVPHIVLGRGPPPITITARRTSPPFPTPQQQSTSLPPLHNPTPSSLFGLLYIGDFASW